MKNSELLKSSRQRFDGTVFLNDQNCYWQSICSGEIVFSRFFSDGRIGFRSHFWWALNFHDVFVTRSLFGWILLLQHFDVFFFENYEQKNIYLKKNGACSTFPRLRRSSPGDQRTGATCMDTSSTSVIIIIMDSKLPFLIKRGNITPNGQAT